jgi:hypothetical protein
VVDDLADVRQRLLDGLRHLRGVARGEGVLGDRQPLEHVVVELERLAARGPAQLELGPRPGELGLRPLELDEHPDLAAQDRRVHGLEDVVDGPLRVAAEHVAGVGADPGDEDDRDVAGPLPPLDQGRRLEAVHARHAGVEQDQGELVVQQPPERLLARAGAHQLVTQRLQDRLHRQEVLGLVVDQQDARLVIAHPAASAAPRRSVAHAAATVSAIRSRLSTR